MLPYVRVVANSWLLAPPQQRLPDSVGAGLPGTKTLDRGQFTFENLAVTDRTTAGGRADASDDIIERAVGRCLFDLHLRQEINHVFSTAVLFRMAFLAAKAFQLGDSHAMRAERGHRFAHVFKLERLDDRPRAAGNARALLTHKR